MNDWLVSIQQRRLWILFTILSIEKPRASQQLFSRARSTIDAETTYTQISAIDLVRSSPIPTNNVVSKTSKEPSPYTRTVPVECLDRKISTATDHDGERYLVNANRQGRLNRFDIPVKAMMEKTTFYRELLRGKKIRGVTLGRHGIVTLDLNYDVFLQICMWLIGNQLHDIWDSEDPAKVRERWSELRDKA